MNSPLPESNFVDDTKYECVSTLQDNEYIR